MFYQGLTKTVMAGQLFAMILFAIIGLALLAATGLAFAGVLPWIDLAVSYGGEAVPWAGAALQTGVTALFLLLAVYVPTNRQVMMLEATHRKFAVSMDDIMHAYKAAHMADRKKAFEMTREFDAVRERYEYLKAHPDLPEIDAELLTIAAQMSQQSRELANEFSDARVQRAEEALRQRKVDAEELRARIEVAQAASRDLRRHIEDVEFQEGSAASQLRNLREDLAELEARIGLKSTMTKGRHLRPVNVNDAS
ncbi:MAG: DNA repair protein [Paracoccaceae bacterium]|nr:DNA repair protein [Paracoccaceae bacterium]